MRKSEIVRTIADKTGLTQVKAEDVVDTVFDEIKATILALLPVAPVNEADTVLLPEALKALKRVDKLTGLGLQGSYLNLDGGFERPIARRSSMRA